MIMSKSVLHVYTLYTIFFLDTHIISVIFLIQKRIFQQVIEWHSFDIPLQTTDNFSNQNYTMKYPRQATCSTHSIELLIIYKIRSLLS